MTTRLIWENDREFKRALREVPDQIYKGARKGLQKGLRGYQRELTRTRLRGRPGLARRSGNLARDLQTTVRGRTVDTLVGIAFFTAKYAPAHEFGATITPKRGRYLAIPLSAVSTPTGIAQYQPRDFPNAFFIRSRKNPDNLVLVEERGSRIVPLFAMVRSVTIPPRLEARETMRSYAPTILREVSDEIRKELRPRR